MGVLRVLLTAGPSRFPTFPWGLVSIVLLSLFMALPAHPVDVFAAGDDIRVLADERHVRFPGDVILNLEVEGQENIVEVRLYYRNPPSEIWTYTYPEMSPSRRVETSFNLDLSGVGYLPPGTELEYYYSIRDSRGNSFNTLPKSFLYVDDRFQWKTVDAGPLSIYWHDQRESRVSEVTGQVERSIQDISALLGVEPERPLRGIIYNSRAEAREAFPYQSETTTREEVFQGFAFPERGVFVGLGLEPNLIVHESAHLLLGEATSSPLASVPAWVNEGFASYVEPDVQGYGRAFLGGATPGTMPLRHMYTVPGKVDAIRYFYRKSESVVGYLLEAHGHQRFRTFLGQLNEGTDVNSALVASYGFGLEGLDQRWASTLADEGPGGNGIGFLTNLDTLLIALLALLGMVLMVANYVVRRLRKTRVGPEDWDGLTEEEWEARP